MPHFLHAIYVPTSQLKSTCLPPLMLEGTDLLLLRNKTYGAQKNESANLRITRILGLEVTDYENICQIANSWAFS